MILFSCFYCFEYSYFHLTTITAVGKLHNDIKESFSSEPKLNSFRDIKDFERKN